MLWLDLLWAGSLPAQLLVEKAVYGSGWIFATSLAWTECTHTRKAAGFCWQTRKDYFLILTQHTPVSQAQNYPKTSFSSAAFPTSPDRCVKHLWRGDWSLCAKWALSPQAAEEPSVPWWCHLCTQEEVTATPATEPSDPSRGHCLSCKCLKPWFSWGSIPRQWLRPGKVWFLV